MVKTHKTTSGEGQLLQNLTKFALVPAPTDIENRKTLPFTIPCNKQVHRKI
jgi:hypothetical protein